MSGRNNTDKRKKFILELMGDPVYKPMRLREMASLDSVPQALEYLKRQPAYEGIFDDMEQQPHRGEIEQRLLLSKLQKNGTAEKKKTGLKKD